LLLLLLLFPHGASGLHRTEFLQRRRRRRRRRRREI
jgi:hypothetical protein